MIGEQVNIKNVLPFTLLMLLHLSLYVVSIFLPAKHQWYRFLYFAIQILLILLIGLVSYRLIVLGLYLALSVEMASMLHKIRLSLLVGAACTLLFSFSLTMGLLYGWDFTSFTLTHIVLPYIIPLGLLIVGYALLFRRQARAHEQTRNLLHELEHAHKQLEDYSARIEELTRAAERRRMARELHDTLAQGLAGIILQLEAGKSHLADHHHERALEIVTQAIRRARSSLAAARCAIDDLRTETMSVADLQQAIEDEIGRFTAATGIPCTPDLSSLSLVPDEFSESIVRSISEGLMNVAQHAQARQVWVGVVEKDDVLTVEVRDNGMGFDATAMTRQGHYGLLGLRERARLLGGQFTLKTTPGQGTAIQLLLPSSKTGDTV